jgi:hypothetical protein
MTHARAKLTPQGRLLLKANPRDSITSSSS